MFPYFEKNIRILSDDTAISSYAKSVYVALAIHADHKTGTCYPSRATIAKHANCSVRTAVNMIKLLSARGYIQKISRRREGTNATTSNLYVLPDLAQHQKQDEPDHVQQMHGHIQTPSVPNGQAQTTAPAGRKTKPGAPYPVRRVRGEGGTCRAPKLNRSNRSIDRSIDVAVKERIDKHFEREFFAEQTEYFEMYQTFADYMGEMLTDPQTVISKVPIKRERLEELIFSANAGNLCDFLAHIHGIRPMLHIRSPKAYYKTAWIEWCRDLAAWRVIPSASRAAHGATTKPNYDDLLEDLTA